MKLLILVLVLCTASYVELKSCKEILRIPGGIRSFIPGMFIPKCKADGTYEDKQCHGSTGFCWCVDPKSGREIKGTKKGPGKGEVDCKSKCRPIICRIFCKDGFVEDKDGCKTCKCKNNCVVPCKKIYKPVCGSDGKTYPNDCVLKIAHCLSKGVITKASEDKCPEKSKCRPIRCRIFCKDGFVEDKDGCKTCKCKNNCVVPCKKIYKPVCGSDGKTYPNDCVLKIAYCESKGVITKASEDKCPEQRMEVGGWVSALKDGKGVR